jgi:hypothetical protein
MSLRTAADAALEMAEATLTQKPSDLEYAGIMALIGIGRAVLDAAAAFREQKELIANLIADAELENISAPGTRL